MAYTSKISTNWHLCFSSLTHGLVFAFCFSQIKVIAINSKLEIIHESAVKLDDLKEFK